MEGHGKRGTVRRLERGLRRVAKAHERPGRLKWYTRMGRPLVRAYATVLLVGAQGGASRMAAMPTAEGELKFPYRGGNVSRRAIVAVAHHHHPRVRILGYRDLAQDTGGVAWAVPEGIVLTDKRDPPPDDWYGLVLDALDVPFERSGTHLHTPDFAAHDDPYAPEAPLGLELTLKTGPTTLHVSEPHVREHLAQRSLIGILGAYLIGLDPAKDITFRPTGTPRDCRHPGKPCLWSTTTPEARKSVQEGYRVGAVSEAALLDHFLERWEDAVRDAPGRLYVLGDACYGDDADAFVKALDLPADTEEAMRRFVDAGPDVAIVPDSGFGKVLEAFWDAAPKVLPALAPDAATLDRILAKHTRSPPTVVLEEVLQAKAAKQKLAGYPVYDTLPTAAAAADRIVRAHHTGGATAATEVVDKEVKRETHKGVLWAALLRFEATQGRDWRFNENDRDAGAFLRPAFDALLDAGPDDYHAKLAELHTLAGGTGDLPAPAGKV